MRTYDTRRDQPRATVGETVLAVAGLLLVIVLLGIAGTMDYEDRVSGLGASMVPSEEWQVMGG